MEHDHRCYCGTATQNEPHQIGDNCCQRFMTDPPDYSDGTTEYTYKEQRGYHQHPCGCWSRWEGSENSIK
jgi:hypothetical protein